jgi:hypothetical protein
MDRARLEASPLAALATAPVMGFNEPQTYVTHGYRKRRSQLTLRARPNVSFGS